MPRNPHKPAVKLEHLICEKCGVTFTRVYRGGFKRRFCDVCRIEHRRERRRETHNQRRALAITAMFRPLVEQVVREVLLQLKVSAREPGE